MKKYFGFLGITLLAALFAVFIMYVNVEIYNKIFGGFPYDILKFSYIIIGFWFVFLTIGLFVLRKFVILITNTYFLDLMILVCGLAGVLGFADVQIEQRLNHMEYSKLRYEHALNRLEAAKNHYERNIEYHGRDNLDLIGWDSEFHLFFLNNIDSIFNKEFDMNKFLTELKDKKGKNEDGILLIKIIEENIKAIEEYRKAEKEYEDTKNSDYKGFYIMAFIAAIVIGLAKMTIVYIKNNYDNDKILE